MQGENTPREFSDEYIERCFEVWYSMNQPSNMQLLQEALPESPEGKKPGKALLRQIRDNYGWQERADSLNALAIQKVETQLVNQKSNMLKHQAEQAFQIATLARDHLLENGFDTSASAVSALFRATEEERTVRGISEFLIKISKLSDEDVMKEAAKLLKRNSEAIEGEVISDDADNNPDPT